MQTQTVTVKQASQTINLMATNFMESNEIDAELLSILNAGITSKNTLHLRDYMLGMPLDFGVQFMINFAEAILENTSEEESYAIKTILCAFYFENLQTEKALISVKQALEIEPNYALAQLLTRVLSAGWSAESFASMRNELHPKVIVALAEESESEI